jgi:hypothetical protein
MKGNPDYSLYRAFVVKSLICVFQNDSSQRLLSETEDLKRDTPEYFLLIGGRFRLI